MIWYGDIFCLSRAFGIKRSNFGRTNAGGTNSGWRIWIPKVEKMVFGSLNVNPRTNHCWTTPHLSSFSPPSDSTSTPPGTAVSASSDTGCCCTRFAHLLDRISLLNRLQSIYVYCIKATFLSPSSSRTRPRTCPPMR
jgi:hypothetical protein